MTFITDIPIADTVQNVRTNKATPSHTLVSGHPPACKISFPVYEDYYYYHRRLIDL